MVRRGCHGSAGSALQRLQMSEVTGKAPRSVRALPRGLQSRVEVDTRGLSAKCVELEDRWRAGDLAGCKAIVGASRGSWRRR